MANEIIFDSEETIRVESNLPEINTKYKGYRIYSSPLYVKYLMGILSFLIDLCLSQRQSIY